MTAAAPKEFSPKAVAYSKRKKKFSAYNKVVAACQSGREGSDHDLDYYVPHPLMAGSPARDLVLQYLSRAASP